MTRCVIPDAFIPAFAEWGLDRVPGYRVDETGAEDPTWRPDWIAWRDAILDLILVMKERCEVDLPFRAQVKALCKADWAFFITLFLVVEEPRPDEEDDTLGDYGHDMLKQFTPFAYQVELIQLFQRTVRSPKKLDVYISKARGIGVSYTMMAAAWAAFLFTGYRGRFLSEKLEKVDRTLDLDSLFGKADLFREYTPDWLLPEGFSTHNRAHRQQGMFKNPVTRAQLTGEATTGNSIRGGRATFVCNDEAAFQENYTATKATISGSTKHAFDWSSESYAKGRQWQNAWKSARSEERRALDEGRTPVAHVIELEWYENPYQDRDWYDEEFARYAAQGNADAFAVEYLRNPDSGYGTLIYPTARDCPDTPEWYMPDRMLFASCDPGIEDLCAWVFWQTYFPGGKKTIRFIDSYTNNKKPVQFYTHWITGIVPVPGDTAYPYIEELQQPQEQYFMKWLREVPGRSLRCYGDPAVRARDSSLASFQAVMNQESLKIRKQAGIEDAVPVHIMVPHEIIHKRNNFHDRRNAMREALMHCEFSLTDGAQSFKEALYSVRFAEMTEKTTRPPGTLHDRFSHQATAGEFGMVYEELRLTDSEVKTKKIADPKRIGNRSTSGLKQIHSPYGHTRGPSSGPNRVRETVMVVP